MSARPISTLVFFTMFFFSVTSLTACNVDTETRTAVDSLVDLGFGLVVPSVIETEQGTKIHSLTLGPSTLYLIEPEGVAEDHNDKGVLLVDGGIPGLERIVLAYMDYKGIPRDKLDLIYITHAHPDHYGSADALRDETGAEITVHAADAPAMTAGEFKLGTVRDWEWVSEMTVPAVERILSQLRPTPPDFTIADGDRLDDYGIDGYVVEAPGHTRGSTVLMLEDAYAFVGDLASNTGGAHAQESYADDWDQLAESLRRVQALEPELVFAGHGPDPMSAEEFQALQPLYGGE